MYVSDTIVAAVWQADKVPFVHKQLGYFVYEGVQTPAQANYQYWFKSGLAGMLAKPILRNKLGLGNLSSSELVAMLFDKKE